MINRVPKVTNYFLNVACERFDKKFVFYIDEIIYKICA